MTDIISNPDIRFGKPIIIGTRITVDEVLGALAGGMTFTEISKEYGLTDEQIRIALRYAASWTEREVIADYAVSA